MIAPGPRAAEEVVVDAIDRLAGRTPDPTLLGAPLRVVVPSRSLRLHLAAELVRRRGRGLVGVEVVTLHGLAAQVLLRAGEALPQGEALFGVLTRRWAREVPALAERLDDLVDGYGAVTATVRDFLDAGFEPGLAEGVAQAALEAARADGRPLGTGAERERAAALAHLAAAVDRGMAALGVGRATHLVRRAADRLAAEPGLLPARALVIHGFAEATAVASDLLAILAARPGSLVVLDRPPDPAEPGAREQAFTERLSTRLETTVGSVAEANGEAPPTILRSFSASGTDAEARELARRIRELLDRQEDPVAPEAIGVVLREIRPDQPYTAALRCAFERVGIPYSGVGAPGPLQPAGRRLLALSELLRRREATPAGRWLDALGAPPAADDGREPHRLFELRLAFHTLGAGRVGEVAALAPERFGRTSFRLPIRQGLEALRGDDGNLDGAESPPGSVAARRRVPSRALRSAAEAARRLVARFRDWPETASLAEHLERLRDLLAEDLGWRRPEARDGSGDPWTALDALEREVPGALELDFDEVVLLLDRTWERDPRASGRDAVGGRGGGVALLAALEARGRTFRHLFVVGLNRGVFPRTIREDPLLPDDLRRALHTVLPELPVKLAGYDEERYLFAHLLAAAPEVTLSWRRAGDDGEPLSVSPLVERLALSPAAGDTAGTPVGEAPPPRLRPAAEHAIEAALAGDRDRFAAILAVALADAHPGLAPGRAAALAATHRAILDEVDPDPSTPEGRATRAALGPYFGFIGPPAAGDPRHGAIYVTALESFSACPWQTLLRRLLRLEPTPDPLEALPGLERLWIGSLVHAVLEDVVRQALPDGGPQTLAEVVAAAGASAESPLGPPLDTPEVEDEARAPSLEPVAVDWPPSAALETLLERRARRLLEEEGLALPGLARALAAAARPPLEAARATDWEQGAVAVFGAEIEGGLEVEDAGGGTRELRFRADRVDAVPERRRTTFRITDYKTGRPFKDAKGETTRRKHLLAEVQAGRRLQAVAYALAAAGPQPWQPDAVGRYLFLGEGVDPGHRELAVWSSDRTFTEGFEAAVRTLLAAWDGGAFFPRLVDPDKDQEPRLCTWCDVREACLRGDSGARGRLAAWAEANRQPNLEASGPSPSATERALLGLWRLPSKERG